MVRSEDWLAPTRLSGRHTTGFKRAKEDVLAVTLQRHVGMLILAVWLILYGLAGMIALVLPTPLMAVLALLAGILILVGR
jgi:hypothetical protein